MKYKKDLLNEGTVRHKELQDGQDHTAERISYNKDNIIINKLFKIILVKCFFLLFKYQLIVNIISIHNSSFSIRKTPSNT